MNQTTDIHQRRDDALPQVGRLRLLEADPDLAGYVPAAEVSTAQRALTAPLISLAEGDFEPAALFSWGLHTFGAMVVDGVITEHISIGSQPTMSLLGEGDMVLAGGRPGELLSSAQTWTAMKPSRLALLDDHTLRAVRHWPGLLRAFVHRADEARARTLVQLAISHQPRVEDRLMSLFHVLAERWGRVTPAGVVVALPLTHESLGRMVGARRPTVTLAVRALQEAGRLGRLSDRSWILDETLGPSGLNWSSRAARASSVMPASRAGEDAKSSRFGSRGVSG